MNKITPQTSPEAPMIGASVARPNGRRLLEGRGRYVDDIALARMAHVAFLRSPHAHARILAIHASAARTMPGVIDIVTGRDLADAVQPFAGLLVHFKGMKSAMQHCIAIDRVAWQGEPVVAIIAETRRQAEDAAARIDVEYEPLPAVSSLDVAERGEIRAQPELDDNICFTREVEGGDWDKAAAEADVFVERRFRFPRHTGVCPEGRSIIGDWNPSDRRLTVYISHQAPHMIQDCYARLLGIAESDVRVVCPDVGGSYGIKTHVYGDELATCALSMRIGRPVKFVADRLESFLSDIHNRDHAVTARLALKRDGTILALGYEGTQAIGPYSVYPRTSVVEGNQIANICGQWYRLQAYRAKVRALFTNLAPYSNYRAVGHPVAVGVTEALVDAAAREIGMDPAEIRRKNLLRDEDFPLQTPSGMKFEGMSHHACLDKVLSMMDYEKLRADQVEARKRGIYRGIGLASMIEITNPSAMFYGVGGARISAQDGCTVRLEPQGGIMVLHGCGEQGQGTETIFAQIVADAVGVPMGAVRLVTGDTDATPYGGGTWASRGAGVGGEAAWQAGRALRKSILDLAATIHQRDAASLDIRRGRVVDAESGQEITSLSEVGRIAYFRPDNLGGMRPELSVTRHYLPTQYAFAFTNGILACHLEADPETGFIKLLKFWAVEDCGKVLNPSLVEEQMRGAIVQGIGPTLFEECLYDSNGQMLNGSMVDYLVPMAAEMPDMDVAHVETLTRESAIGAKGAGEAGTAGAPAAIMNALNDALSPFRVEITEMPFTPERILRALGKA